MAVRRKIVRRVTGNTLYIPSLQSEVALSLLALESKNLIVICDQQTKLKRNR